MTTTFKPMLLSSGPLRSDSDLFAFEVKWDGFRSLVDASPARVMITSRNGNDMTSRYPELQRLSGSVPAPVVLDGELVVLDADGRPDFAALWFRSRPKASARPGETLCLMAFDVLRIGDKTVIDRPYWERRRILDDLNLEGPHWCTPASHVGAGAALFAATEEMGLEGVVAKRLDSRYRPGVRSRSWIKTKHFQTRTFALLGWVPPHEWRGDRGCVALGLASDDGIAFAGVVESGYGRELVDELPHLTRGHLTRLRKADARWEGAQPPTGRVKYLEWSLAGGLRHATLVSDALRPAR